MKITKDLPSGCLFGCTDYQVDIPSDQQPYPMWMVFLGTGELSLSLDPGWAMVIIKKESVRYRETVFRKVCYLFENYWHARAFYLKMEKELVK